MNGVGGDHGVHSGSQDLGVRDFLHQLQPPLRLQIADQAERGPGVVAQALQRETEEFGRGVHQQHGAVDIAAKQSPGEDAGAGGVVQEHVAFPQEAAELVQGGFEVAVPALMFNGVVADCEIVDRAMPPFFFGYAFEAFGPGKRCAGVHGSPCLACCPAVSVGRDTRRRGQVHPYFLNQLCAD